MAAYIYINDEKKECVDCKKEGEGHPGWHRVILQMPGMVDVINLEIRFFK